VSALLCERCGSPALVIYERRALCGPCAVEALDENQHYLVIQVDDRKGSEEDGSTRNTKSTKPV